MVRILKRYTNGLGRNAAKRSEATCTTSGEAFEWWIRSLGPIRTCATGRGGSPRTRPCWGARVARLRHKFIGGVTYSSMPCWMWCKKDLAPHPARFVVTGPEDWNYGLGKFGQRDEARVLHDCSESCEQITLNSSSTQKVSHSLQDRWQDAPNFQEMRVSRDWSDLFVLDASTSSFWSGSQGLPIDHSGILFKFADGLWHTQWVSRN